MPKILFVDSHCHLDRLDLKPYQGKLENALNAARTEQVGYFLNVCVHPTSINTLIQMAESQPDMSISVGIHPTEHIDQEPSVEQLIEWASHPLVAAIGETGLDYLHTGNTHHQQQRFRRHIQAAKAVNKPLIIHTRAAIEDTLRILHEEKAQTVGGVLHCFTETLEMAQHAIQHFGFYISFSGILTFKNAENLRAIAAKLPLNRLLIETDSPYLTPVPFRGKKSNYPGYVVYVAQMLATLHKTSDVLVGKQTTENFFKLFYTIRT